MFQALRRFSFDKTVEYANRMQQYLVLKYDQGGKKYGYDKFQGYPPAHAAQEIADLSWYNQHSDHVIRAQHRVMEEMLVAVESGDWIDVEDVATAMHNITTEIGAVIEQAEDEGYVSVSL